jgi:hypothetical protein
LIIGIGGSIRMKGFPTIQQIQLLPNGKGWQLSIHLGKVSFQSLEWGDGIGGKHQLALLQINRPIDKTTGNLQASAHLLTHQIEQQVRGTKRLKASVAHYHIHLQTRQNATVNRGRIATLVDPYTKSD